MSPDDTPPHLFSLYVIIALLILSHIPDVVGKWIIGLMALSISLFMFAIIAHWILGGFQIVIQLILVEC
jgi:hypothetical protein